MAEAANGFDLIIDTVPVKHSLDPYLPQKAAPCPLFLGRRRVAGSPIGGIRETQEMLEFCAEKNLLPEWK